MLLHHVGVGIADADSLALLHDIELLIEGHHLDTTVLVTDDALSDAIKRATVVSSTFTDDSDRVHSQVHVHSGSWLQLRHSDEDRLAKGRSLLLGRLGASWLLLSCGFHHFSL